MEFFASLELAGWRGEIAIKIIKEIADRLGFLANVGLGYLTLDRSADTLSGGEAQRIRLASQIGSGLVGVMYILDEPSIGLHQRDNQRLLDTLVNLRDLGNTVIVVEHDEDAIRQADHVVDLGPGAGVHGGAIVAQGTAAEVAAHPDSITGQFLSGRRRIEIPQSRHLPDPKRMLRLIGATANNLKNLTVEFPLGVMTAVTGVSGSGKSTLVNDTLFRAVATQLNHASAGSAHFDRLEGLEHIDRVIEIDQSPIGRTPRSNPATYTGLFAPIREIFASVPESRARGYEAGRFSFNVKGGRCEACQGDGVIKVEMHFLADVYVPCDVCRGKRYNRETLEIRFKGKNIQEVLDMTVEDALPFFSAVPTVQPKLKTLARCRDFRTCVSARARPPCRAARRSASSSRRSSPSAPPAARCTFSTSRPRGCTSRTSSSCWSCCTGCAMRGTRSSSSSTTSMSSRPRTGLSISARRAAMAVASVVAVGAPEAIAANDASHTAHYLKGVLEPRRASSPRAAQRKRA